MRAIVPLLLAVSLPLSAAPLHSQFLPRRPFPAPGSADQPAIVAGHRLHRGGGYPASVRPATHPHYLFLADAPEGQAIEQGLDHWPGADQFRWRRWQEPEKPLYDDNSRTLTLNYPMADYRVIMDLLRNETLYVQFLTYANGHVWADLHTGTVRTR